MARRSGQRAFTKLHPVCCKVTAMLEARMNEPPLVPLSWVGYLALALVGAEALRVPFGCVVPYSLGGRLGEIRMFVSEKGGRMFGRKQQGATEGVVGPMGVRGRGA